MTSTKLLKPLKTIEIPMRHCNRIGIFFHRITRFFKDYKKKVKSERLLSFFYYLCNP